MRKLTFRQRIFLERLLDLYHQEGEPVHYSRVAEGLGVSGTTAYEMLRLLEEKGYVASAYRLRKGRSGPGRSMVVFYPTSKAKEKVRELAAGGYNREEWQEAKERILIGLSQEDGGGEALLKELLAKIPQDENPLIYCAEVMTALLLTLREQIALHFKEHPLVRMIMSGERATEAGLGFLPGMALGMSLAEKANRHLRDRFLSYVEQYERHLRRMDEGARRRLLDFLREVTMAFQREGTRSSPKSGAGEVGGSLSEQRADLTPFPDGFTSPT